MSRIVEDYMPALKSLNDRTFLESGPRHYLVAGKNPFLSLYFIEALRSAFSRAGASSPVTYFYSDIDWDDESMGGQASLFEETSVRILSEVPCPKGIGNAARILTGMHRYVVVFQPADDTAHKGLREIVTRKDVRLIPCDDPGTADMKALGLEMAARLGISLSAEGWRSILTNAGNDPAHLRNDLRLQSMVWQNRDNLSAADVSSAAGYLREDNAFKLSDLLLKQDLAAAEALLKDLDARGESPLALVGLLARHCRNALMVAEMAQTGAPVGRIASELRLPQFVISSYSQYGRATNFAKIAAALSSLSWSDRQIKSTNIPEALLFGSFISDLS